MNELELDKLIASVSPLSDEEISQLDLEGADSALLSQILATPKTALPHSKDPSHRPLWGLVSVAAAALIIFVGFAITLSGPRASVAWASQAIDVAEQAPRLLLNKSNAHVVEANEFTTERGMVTFGDGNWLLDLHWSPATEYGYLIKDRSSGSIEEAEISVLNIEARTFKVGLNDYHALWTLGNHSVEARGQFDSFDQFAELVGSLREVGVDEWLQTMPDTVVLPDGRARSVDQMLLDVPLPAGFDLNAFRQAGIMQDRYQLGAALTTQVTCDWLKVWLNTTDETARQEASSALISSRDWQVLHQINLLGGAAEVIWEFADAIEDGGTLPGGYPLTISESYHSFCEG